MGQRTCCDPPHRSLCPMLRRRCHRPSAIWPHVCRIAVCKLGLSRSASPCRVEEDHRGHSRRRGLHARGVGGAAAGLRPLGDRRRMPRPAALRRNQLDVVRSAVLGSPGLCTSSGDRRSRCWSILAQQQQIQLVIGSGGLRTGFDLLLLTSCMPHARSGRTLRVPQPLPRAPNTVVPRSPGLVVATAAACLLEAATTQLDNIFVPLQYFALLSAFSAG